MRTEARCFDCFQFQTGIFSGLPDEERTESLCLLNMVDFERKQPVFIEGDAAHLVYLVRSGLIKVFKNTAQNRTQIINVVGPGEIVGIESLFSPYYNATAVPLTKSEICYCQSVQFHTLIEKRPSVAVRVIGLLHNDLARIHAFLCDLGTKKAISRVASCLLFFKEKQTSDHTTRTFQLPVMRNEMSELLGISPETISRQLRSLVTDGIIDVDNKRVLIKDLKGLVQIATHS